MSDLRERCLAAAREKKFFDRSKLEKQYSKIKKSFEAHLECVLGEHLESSWVGQCPKNDTQEIQLYLTAYHPELDITFMASVYESLNQCSKMISIPLPDGSEWVVEDLASLGRYLVWKDETPRA